MPQATPQPPYSSQWATDALSSLQSDFNRAWNGGHPDWAAVYDLYANPNADGLCSKDDFTKQIFPAIATMTAEQLASIIAAMLKPPTEGRLLSADDSEIKWSVTGPNNLVSIADAVKVNGRWLFQSTGGPCGDFIG